MRVLPLGLMLGLAGILVGTQGLAAAFGADRAGAALAGQPSWIAPKDWTVVTSPRIDRVRAPEQDFEIAIIQVGPARDAVDALARGWAIYRPGAEPKPGELTPIAPGNGWDDAREVHYARAPSEHAITQSQALRAGKNWTVLILDGAVATFGKRGSAIVELTQALRAPGFTPESFSGRQAAALDPVAVEKLLAFVRGAMTDLDIPGVGLAIVDRGRVVWEGGIGVRDLATRAPVDAHTKFMIASNTKGMTTLLLAHLVDEGKLAWDEPTTAVFPEFRLADPEVTRKVLVRHLVCACTGLPRKDGDWGFTAHYDTPPSEIFRLLSLTKPTSAFGDVYQYNNLLPAAAGYIGAHVAYPDLALGEGYDLAMQTKVFNPLGMNETTFDAAAATSGDHATPYAESFDGTLARVRPDANDSAHMIRPSGGAWSTPHDMLLYVRNELDLGVTPDGRHLFSSQNLLRRRDPNVKIGLHGAYGMGLKTEDMAGVQVVHHGGSLPGFMSDWYAVPSAGVGVVLLTNSDSGVELLRPFQRRLMEVLYDGRPEAQQQLTAAVAQRRAYFASLREGASITVTPELLARLAPSYSSSLGTLRVIQNDKRLVFEINGAAFHTAWRRAADGSLSFVTVEPGLAGFEFTAGEQNGKKVIVADEGQNQYVFTEADKASFGRRP